MIVYIPTLITSVEQAEALPEDTVAIRPRRFACEKALGMWRNTDAAILLDADMIGFTALVPIEAEDETSVAEVQAAKADAAREALTEYAKEFEGEGSEWIEPMGPASIAKDVRDFIKKRYPEEQE